jgi:hypothetical protein
MVLRWGFYGTVFRAAEGLPTMAGLSNILQIILQC